MTDALDKAVEYYFLTPEAMQLINKRKEEVDNKKIEEEFLHSIFLLKQ
jgi:hypothetical protein